MKPLVSVLLVTYNAGRHLAESVASILGQTYQALELIVVDNASTDGSVAALEQNCRDERLKIVRQEKNLFHNGGLNAGLPHCRGEFIALMDADDISLPNRLERQITTLAAAPEIAATGCAALTMDEVGRVTGREFSVHTSAEIACYAQFDMPFIFPTLTGRRELFAHYPFRAELAVSHDLDFLARASETSRFLCLHEPLLHYRRHAAGTSARSRPEMFAGASVARLATARRRSGKEENFTGLLAEKNHFMQTSRSEGEVFAFYARRALDEKLFLQAIWHARKAATFGRLEGLMLVARTLRMARRDGSAEMGRLWRLACRGTIRAFNLHPTGI